MGKFKKVFSVFLFQSSGMRSIVAILFYTG